jgi:hypothetical protein
MAVAVATTSLDAATLFVEVEFGVLAVKASGLHRRNWNE